jgi:predicted molibdopterin-dependent oxidoreductase YjgC
MITVTLNGSERQFEEGMSVLEAAKREGIDIPTLCYHESLGPYGVCRLCLVEAEGPGFRRTLLTSCNLKVSEGLIIETDTHRVNSVRKSILELLLAGTPNTEPLLRLAKKLGVEGTHYLNPKKDKCILCGLCVRVCRMKIGAAALDFATDGKNDRAVAEYVALSQERCIGCGSCANICPIGVIKVKDSGGQRYIYLYEQLVNTLKLVRCENCGQPYTTQKFLDFVSSRLDNEVSSKIKLGICPECSREYYTVALTGQFPVFEEFPPIL